MVVGDKVGGDKVTGDKIVESQGTVDVSGTAHIAVGVNTGTIQAFFGAQPPNNAKELLDSYLESLLVDHAHLRLGKQFGKAQTGREQAVAPCELQNYLAQVLQDYLAHALTIRRQIHCTERLFCVVT